MKATIHRMCIPALAAFILAGCSDSTPPLVGKWNFQSQDGYQKGVMEFAANGTGSFRLSHLSALILKWQHLEGEMPDGYPQAIQIVAERDGKANDPIQCGYKIELDSLSFGKCKQFESLRFTRATQ